MSRKLANVVRVAKVSDIANSANLSVAEMEDKGWRVVVSRGSTFTRADAECDEEIECWLRNIASATLAYLESDEYSYNDEHELLLEYRCWG